LTSSSAAGNQWYKDGSPISGETNQTYSATASGAYTVIVTASGCSSAASSGTTVTVNPIPATPTIGAGGPTTFCAGGSVVLTSSSATGNQWYKDGSPISGGINQTYTASTSGNYTVIVTSAEGCSSAASSGTTVTVNVIPTTPTIGAGGPTTFCTGGSVVLTSSSAAGNQWYKDGSPISGGINQTYTATTSGNYTVVVTSAEGCSSAASAGTAVTENAIPSAPASIVGKLRVIAGSSQTYAATAVTGATSYTWSTPTGWVGTSTTNSITLTAGTTGGTVSVVANANGCTSPATSISLVIVPDFDGDGLADEDDLDDDNDGILDTVENAACSPAAETCDTDGDGTPNKFDLDSDADGISDVYEANGTDTDKDGKADGAVDANGVPASAKGGLTPPDTDKDGKTDPYDVDSDGDGIPDKEEGIKDTDGDGIPDFRDVDSDGDGIPDDKEYGPTPGKPIDTDGDGIPDYLDIDSDNDGITDRSENGAGPAIIDTDGDKVPDYLDLDSDGDGLTDVLEADGTDADKDGRADGTADSKGVPSSAKGGLTGPDTDGDGKRDFQDVDSDADGIPDNTEGQVTYVKPAGKDTDKDGVDDAYDKDNGGTPIVPVDTDKDGKPDFRDVDSDGDGIPDAVEAGADPKNPIDTDKDGIPDYRELDSDNDGIPDAVEAGPDPKNPIDTDKDGTPDYRDLDSDNDGIPDAIERGPDGAKPLDTDKDGIPDYRDLDSDNDGIPDAIERGPDGSKPIDTDKDGIPDYRELDSDNDGIPDAIEAGPDPKNPVDTDKDGTPDYRDLDSDNDGIPDSVEAGPDPKNPLDTDKDGIADFRELDSDNDSIPDADEAGPDPTKPLDSDGDGIPDYRELDSTNDGIPDNETLLIFKTASKPVLSTDGSFTYTYTITLRNARKEPLNSVQVKEDLTKTFVSPMAFSVVSVKTSVGLTAATGFDGRSQINLIGSGITLAGLGKETIEITVKVLPNGYAGNVNNTAEGSAVAKWFNVTRQSIDTTASNGRKHGTGLPTLTVLPMVDIKISDVITPNNDGFNDKWIILRPSNVKVGVTIFNRWGQVVYKTADYKNDWYGTGTNGALGNLLPQGTYYYLVELTGGVFTNKEVRKGYLTIKRDY